MYTGFKYATKAGVSFCSDDMLVPEEKNSIISPLKKKYMKLKINIHLAWLQMVKGITK